jgi:hypothetical protein
VDCAGEGQEGREAEPPPAAAHKDVARGHVAVQQPPAVQVRQPARHLPGPAAAPSGRVTRRPSALFSPLR